MDFNLKALFPLFRKPATRAGMVAAPSLLREVAVLTPEAALACFDSTDEGLTESESLERFERYGENVVAQEKPKPAWLRLLELLASPLSLLLLVLAVVAELTGEVRGAILITVMVALSVLLSFLQEFRSNRAAQQLRALVHTTATVLRRDKRKAIPAEVMQHFPVQLNVQPPQKLEIPLARLARGDVVLLLAGDMVPADVRLLAACDLFINQAALTGESLPVEKFAAACAAPAGVTDFPNIAFTGSNVVSGSAQALVLATGGATSFGAIAQTVAGARELTSFDRGINGFFWLMIRFMAVMVPLVFLINGLTKGNWLEAFLFAVSVAVGLEPEMLPMIVTINLAKGALAMARKKAIVKRLNSIQNFGAMDVLCTDKTGALTQDRVILEKHVDIEGNESEHVLQLAYLNSYYQSGLKNLLDVAVLSHVEVHRDLHETHRYVKIDEIPFDFLRRRKSVIVAEDDGRHLLICKGAVEEVFSRCTSAERSAGRTPVGPDHLGELQDVVRELNEDGFRVIAVACKEVPVGQPSYSVADESELVLIGYIAFLDPPKESASAALKALADSGVTVKVLTGDNEVVTRKICRDVGLDVQAIALGGTLDALSDAELDALVEHTTVFAKLAPQQKAHVIAALHRRGHAVGFLGDGINDGPALKAADVGISVDTAVDIAKESADIILLEKSLLVLEGGVREGRRVFGNIMK